MRNLFTDLPNIASSACQTDWVATINGASSMISWLSDQAFKSVLFLFKCVDHQIGAICILNNFSKCPFAQLFHLRNIVCFARIAKIAELAHYRFNFFECASILLSNFYYFRVCVWINWKPSYSEISLNGKVFDALCLSFDFTPLRQRINSVKLLIIFTYKGTVLCNFNNFNLKIENFFRNGRAFFCAINKGLRLGAYVLLKKWFYLISCNQISAAYSNQSACQRSKDAHPIRNLSNSRPIHRHNPISKCKKSKSNEVQPDWRQSWKYFPKRSHFLANNTARLQMGVFP